MNPPPPLGPSIYRIVTDRLILRCLEPADAPRLLDALQASGDHLTRWLPWAREPSLDRSLADLHRIRGLFDLGLDWSYGVQLRSTDRDELIGGIGLHTRAGPGAREIGYWLRVSQIGRGYITEAVAAVTRIAFEHHRVERIEIRVAPGNPRSLAVPERLGYVREGVLRRRIRDGARRYDAVMWTMMDSEFPTSPAAAVTIQAFDAIGRTMVPPQPPQPPPQPQPQPPQEPPR